MISRAKDLTYVNFIYTLYLNINNIIHINKMSRREAFKMIENKYANKCVKKKTYKLLYKTNNWFCVSRPKSACFSSELYNLR
jgi:hypothetical protein